ncbi:TlpA family protein disulfide reductase [Saccharicrinis sp. FJH2]|uniref:TlpA family protein disulfide reductase n=1 Tax=Saccharicrinis sp. FJH65 TaxID=3344659 RepID=UPI0035F320DE
MKINQLIYVAIFIVIVHSCIEKHDQINHFSTYSDTLVIESTKQKGIGIFHQYAYNVTFLDTNEWKKNEWFKDYPDYKINYPPNIKDLKLGFHYIWFYPFRYFDEKSNKISVQKNTALADRQILMITGNVDNKEVFIVDNNNNKDLTDDSIRTMGEFDRFFKNNLIECTYRIDYGDKRIEDSGWFQIGMINNQIIASGAQHLLADIYIDNVNYQIAVNDYSPSSFCFYSPVLSVLESNSVRKDTLLKNDQFELGEYLILGDHFYKFHKLYNGSGTIILTKNNRPDTLIGTQIGMIAPVFNGQTMDGDTISYQNYKGRYLLLINVSSCWSKVSSYQCYKDLTEAYKGKFYFLGIDNSPNMLRQNIKDLKLTGKFIIAENNSIIQKAYRPEFCSRTCFLINPKGRIVDRFEIFDWKSHLSDYFEN